ncbi:MAG: replication factor C large subunit [Candidatus Hecatellales archaeon]|nr:MAG: replication factor C large subunit [Candidatus Hecatellales archaeon]
MEEALWTVKYKPKRLAEVVDQAEAKEKLLRWLEEWKPGGKAALLYGPPGNGKTCTVEALAEEKGLDLLQTNASDVRSEEKIERFLGRSVKEASLLGTRGKLILIDEVDGLEASADRGGVRAILRIIRESAFPVILTANDPWDRRLYEIRDLCELIEFKKVPIRDVVKRLEYICRSEGVKADPKLLHAIAEKNRGDLRGAILDLETIAQGRKQLTPEDLEALGKREQETDIFEALRTVFKARSALSAKLSISNVDMDPGEIFWWIAENVANEYERPEDLARAYEALARADLFRSRIIHRQNWRMQAYMVDLMTAGVSQAKKEPYRKFTRYQRPERLRFYSKTMVEREKLNQALRRIASRLHCSTRKVKTEFLPYLLYQAKKQKDFAEKLASAFNLTREEINLISSFYK